MKNVVIAAERGKQITVVWGRGHFYPSEKSNWEEIEELFLRLHKNNAKLSFSNQTQENLLIWSNHLPHVVNDCLNVVNDCLNVVNDCLNVANDTFSQCWNFFNEKAKLHYLFGLISWFNIQLFNCLLNWPRICSFIWGSQFCCDKVSHKIKINFKYFFKDLNLTFIRHKYCWTLLI